MDNLIEIILKVREGNNQAFEELCEKHKPLIDSMSHKFHDSCQTIDVKDFEQESIIAVYNAALKFDIEQKDVTFGLYVKICIQNRLISCIRKANSKKRRKNAETKELQVSDATHQDSFLHYGSAEDYDSLANTVLSQFELKVYKMRFLQDASIQEISEKMGKNKKSINNAIYKIRTKLRKNKI